MHNNTPVRLLYIEDNEVIGLLMQERLGQYGYQIELAKNGEIGLSRLDKHHYDIVIVDYLLPGMSGLQVLQHLFEHHKRTPAIMVTGAGNEEIAVEVMKLGGSDYLVKDTYGHYFELLPSVIERILEKQQLINEKRRIERALQDRDAILEAVSFAAEQFLTASCWTQPIQAVLARLGQAAQVSRAYIFKNRTDQQAVLTPCYHWFSDNTYLATQADFPRWRQLLSQGQAVYGLVEELPARETEALQAQQIQSMVAVPIFVGKQWWGFIRYDDCQSRHTWLPIVVEALKTAANILGAAIQQKQTDQALQHSEQQLNTFVQTADDMFCFRTLAGELIPLNAAFVKITGYSTDEFAQHWRTLMHPSDLKRWDDFCAQHPAGIDTFEWEYRLRTPLGEWRWIHSRMVGSQNEQGDYSGYNCVDRDITERKRTEDALRRSEAQLAQAQRIAHLGSWEWDVHTNTYWWSMEAFHIAGITPTADGIHDNIFHRQIHPADQAEVQHKQQQLQHHPQGYQLEFRILRPDGKMRYVHCRAQPVCDDTQQLSRLLGTVQDITERKLSEEALRRSEQTLRAMMNATTDTVIMLTPEGICVTLNPTAEAILNTQRPIMGQCLYELLLPDLRAQVRSMVEQVVATQEPVFFVDARQGIWFEGNFYPVIHENKVTHVVIFARDITERKLAEDALTQNEQALRAILNAVTDTIVLLEQNETCVVINPAGASKLGHPSDDIIGQCIYDFLPPEAVQKRKAVVEQVIQTQAPVVQEDKRNGIWFEDNFYPVLDERNTVSQIAIFSRDITERKRAQQALLESKRRYESIFNGAEVSIWEQDFYAVWQQLQKLKHQGITELKPYLQAHPHYVQQLSQHVTIKAVNAATLRVFAAANQVELLAHLEDLSTPDTRNTFIAILGAIWDNQRVFQAETRYQTLSGRPLTVMFSMPIPSEAEEFRHIPVSILDITERQQAEQKLRESEERYRQLFVGNQAVEWLVDPKDGRIIDANEAASRYYGYSLAQLKTMTVYELNPGSPAALAEQIHQAQAKNGGQFFFQHRLASGEIRDVEVHSGPVVIEGKALLYSIIHDITERRQAERALRESEKKYRTIINTTAEGYWLIDPRTQVTREVNESLCRMLGYKRSEMIGKTPFEFLDEESHRLLEIPLRQLTTTAHYSQELALKKRNGDKVFIQANATLMYDYTNKSLSLFAFITDITTRKRAEEALRKERDFTNAVINTAGSLVIVFDRQGRIVRFNQTCERISGYRFTEVQQYPIWDIVVLPEELATVKDAFERLNAHQQPVRYESHWLTKKQQLRLIDWFNTVLLDDQGDIEYIIGTGIDITERKQAEQALERTLAEQDAILDNSMVGIALLAADRTFLRVNQKLEDIFGYAETELMGHSTEILYPSQQAFEQLGAKIYPAVEQGLTHESEQLMRRRQGQCFWCRFLIKAIDAHDLSKGYIWNLEDVTEQRQAEENLRLAATVFETTTEAILVTDADNRIIIVNPAFTTITGYQLAEVIGKRPNLLKSGYHDDAFYCQMWQSLIECGKWQGEIRNIRKDGEQYVSWTSIVVIRDHQEHIVQYVAVFSDITQRKQAEELIWRQANYDALTQLPNRTLFTDRLNQAIRTAKREHSSVALMFLDLDRFKWVNDNLGHSAGDNLLQEAAQRLSQCIRESDTVARLGGDEFTVILPQIEIVAAAQTIAERILVSLAKPFILDTQEVSIAASIGITLFPKDGHDIETLMKNSDAAMYRAKESGRNTFRFFTTHEYVCDHE